MSNNPLMLFRFGDGTPRRRGVRRGDVEILFVLLRQDFGRP